MDKNITRISSLRIPDYNNYVDYFNEAGLYDLDGLRALSGKFQLDDIDDIDTRVLILTGLGKRFLLEGNMKRSFSYFNQAKSIIDTKGKFLHPDVIAFYYSEYNQLFSVFGDNDNMVFCVRRALQYAKSKKMISLVKYKQYLNVSNRDDNDLLDMITYVDKLKSVDKYSIYVIGLFRVGIIFREKNDFKNAKYYFQLSLKESQKLGMKHTEFNIHNSMGYLFIRQGQLSQGIDYLRKYKDDTESHTTRTLMIENIAYAYYLMSDYATAAEEFLEAYNTAKINGVIQQLPIQCYYLGKCHEKLDQHRQALSYYKLGYDHSQEQLKMGFSYSADRKKAMETYTKYVEQIAFNKIKEQPKENMFQFALGKTWRDIHTLFQYNYVMVNIRKSNDLKAFLTAMKMKESTYFAMRTRLSKQGFVIPNIKDSSKPYQPEYKLESLISYIETNLTELGWKDANQRFEKDMFRFLYQHYGFQKKRLEDILQLSYPSVWMKLKKLEGPY